MSEDVLKRLELQEELARTQVENLELQMQRSDFGLELVMQLTATYQESLNLQEEIDAVKAKLSKAKRPLVRVMI